MMQIEQFTTDYHEHESKQHLALLFKLALSSKHKELTEIQIMDLISFYESLHLLLGSIYEKNNNNKII